MGIYTEIENQILAALTQIADARVVESYGGQFTVNANDIQDIILASLKFPSLFVSITGRKFHNVNLQQRNEIQFNVWVADKNTRSENKARRGDKFSAGVYSLMEQVQDVLKYFRIDLIGCIGHVAAVEEKILFFSKSSRICVAEQKFIINMKGQI